jgi:hypothetical protein
MPVEALGLSWTISGWDEAAINGEEIADAIDDAWLGYACLEVIVFDGLFADGKARSIRQDSC